MNDIEGPFGRLYVCSRISSADRSSIISFTYRPSAEPSLAHFPSPCSQMPSHTLPGVLPFTFLLSLKLSSSPLSFAYASDRRHRTRLAQPPSHRRYLSRRSEDRPKVILSNLLGHFTRRLSLITSLLGRRRGGRQTMWVCRASRLLSGIRMDCLNDRSRGSLSWR